MNNAIILPPNWEFREKGYAVDSGQTKAERQQPHYVRSCRAKEDGNVITWSQDGNGVPASVILACIKSISTEPI